MRDSALSPSDTKLVFQAIPIKVSSERDREMTARGRERERERGAAFTVTAGVKWDWSRGRLQTNGVHTRTD